jgi:dTDP-4-dehydrorhamnose 3,5-epimerase
VTADIQQKFPGVYVRQLAGHDDSRGWLIELFRDDELPEGFRPAMGYISLTHPGISRGPHEHAHQTDGFAFVSGKMRLYLWENRPGMGNTKLELDVGESNPLFITVPPGVVHAYKNMGNSDATVLNFPDKLYCGHGKQEPVDEIRHEDDEDSRFSL